MKTNWNQVLALMALNAAVVISWMAYHNYQPKILELFHFQQLSTFLVIAQALILVVIPPVAGVVGDYMIKKDGNSFVVFTVGISVTAMIFMSVAFTVGTSNTSNLTSALPFMIVIWLISMNIFHSPANSMLELFAPAKELPSAMAVMVITTDVLYAFENRVVDFVDWIGPVGTFSLGGALLIVTGFFFRRSTRHVSFVRHYEEAKNEKTNFVKVIGAGLFLGVATAFIKNLLPRWLRDFEGTFIQDSSWLISLVLVVSAIAAWPLSNYVKKISVGSSLIYGLAGTFLALAAAYFLPLSLYTTIPMCLMIGLFYSMASVSAFPLALRNLSPRQMTVGAGIFFGGVELAESIMNISGVL